MKAFILSLLALVVITATIGGGAAVRADVRERRVLREAERAAVKSMRRPAPAMFHVKQ